MGGDEVKASVCNRLLDNLASIAAAEVKKTGKFVIPGVTMIKTRRKPATKAGIWPGGVCKGKAGEDNCEGLPSFCLEEEHLIEGGCILAPGAASLLAVGFLAKWAIHG